MTAATRTRRVIPTRPRLLGVSLLSRAVCPCEILPAGLPGLCSINGRAYTLEYNATLPAEGEPVIHGYRVTSIDSYKAYDIDAETLECDCEDATYSRVQCKHSAAVESLRKSGKLA